MSYLVLARKYRPQTFDEIVGQRHVSRTLSAAIESGRIAHAYLFTGTRGVGKTTAARILAKSLNCEHGPTAKPCNKCRNCVEITKGSSTDVFEIDGASNTGVDDVRELRENVKFLPQASRYKIIIIDEVHMLSTNAFNALLKTLEEPPEHVVFIFATTEVHKIPDTILSRCQQYDFKMIPLREIHDALKAVVKKEKIKLSDDQLVLIARKAEGSMRDAMSYLDQALSFAGEKLTTEELVEVLGIMDRRVLLDLSGAILTGETDKTLDILEGMAAVAWDVKQFYGDLMEHFRNLVIAKLSKRPEKLVNATSDELEALQTQVENVSYETLENLFSIIVQSEEEIVRSAYPRLILEMTLIRLATARPVKALDELAGEIGRLRGLLASGKGSMAPSGGGMGGSGSGRHGTSRPSTPPRGGSSYRASEPGPSPATTSAAPSNGPAPVNGAASVNGTSSTSVSNGMASPPPAAPSAPSGNGSVKDFLALLGQRDYKLATLMNAGSADFAGGVLTLRLPKGLHFTAFLNSKDQVHDYAVEVFGPGARVELESVAGASNGATGNIQRRQEIAAQRSREQKELEAQALKDPVVKKILESVPGLTIEVRPEGR